MEEALKAMADNTPPMDDSTPPGIDVPPHKKLIASNSLAGADFQSIQAAFEIKEESASVKPDVPNPYDQDDFQEMLAKAVITNQNVDEPAEAVEEEKVEISEPESP